MLIRSSLPTNLCQAAYQQFVTDTLYTTATTFVNPTSTSTSEEEPGDNAADPDSSPPQTIGCTATFDCTSPAALTTGMYGIEILNSGNNLFNAAADGGGAIMCGSVTCNNTCSVVMSACEGADCNVTNAQN